MVGDVFSDWMTCLNNEFKNAGRKVLMIMDNSSTHTFGECNSDNFTWIQLPSYESHGTCIFATKCDKCGTTIRLRNYCIVQGTVRVQTSGMGVISF